MREKDVKKDGGEEGIEEILPLVFSQSIYIYPYISICLTASRVSAAELALFHTGAILSSLGYCPPATASWEHFGEDACLCSVIVCVGGVRAHRSCFRQCFYTQPPLHPLSYLLSVSTTAQPVRPLEATLLSCFRICWDIFVFLNVFSSATSPECFGAFTANLLNHLIVA